MSKNNDINSDVDLKIVGQIISAIGVLNIFPSGEEAGKFLIPLMNSVPGCHAVNICLRWSKYSIGDINGEQCDLCKKQHSGQFSCGLVEQDGVFVYPLETVVQIYGYLIVSVDVESNYKKYEPFVRNLCNAFALILENSRQKKELQQSAEILEQRVKERTEELDRYFSSSLDLLCIADTDGYFHRLNPEWEKTLGYMLADMEGKKFLDFVHPEDKESTLDAMKKLSSQDNILNFMNRYRCKDGSYRWMEWKASPFGSMIYAVARDITERMQAEVELITSKEKYRIAVLDLNDAQVFSKVGSWKWDIKNNEVSWSDEMYRIFGIDKHSYTGRLGDVISKVIHPDDLHIVLPSNASEFAEKKPMEYRIILPDKSIRNIFAKTGDVQTDNDGNIIFLTGTAQDITDRKQSEESLRQAQKRESIVLLAGGIAHNFNNLLLSMMGNVNLAKKRIPADSPAEKNLERSYTAMLRAATLTKQMLSYSGKGKVEIIPIDMGKTVQEHIDLLEASLPKNVRIATDLSPTPVTIKGDPSQIEQIIMNVIINAGEAIGEKQGIVDITVSSVTLNEEALLPYGKLNNQVLKTGEYALFQVKDNGIGMDEETLAKIFDPFFTTNFVGRGLGLAAVSGIVRGHNGGIMVESKKGIGTTFKVIIPIHTPVIEPPKQKVSQQSETIVHTPTVLLIDDEQYVIELIQDIFSDEPYQLLTAKDPSVGVTMYQEQWRTIDVVILDYSMPKMNGRDVLIELRKINPEVKAILSSGYSDEELARLMGNVIPTASIGKPHTPLALLSKISEVLKMQ